MAANSFIHWIGGSFTTKKLNPKDIDLVTIMSRSDYQKNRRLIEARFRRKSSWHPSVDAYILQVPATDDSKSTLFRSDLLYWTHQFTYTRKGRTGKRHTRGFIELRACWEFTFRANEA